MRRATVTSVLVVCDQPQIGPLCCTGNGSSGRVGPVAGRSPDATGKASASRTRGQGNRPLACADMFTRLKWFLFGSAATIGAGAYLGTRIKRARERLTAENMARAGVVTVAGMMNATGRRLQRAGLSDESEGVESGSG